MRVQFVADLRRSEPSSVPTAPRGGADSTAPRGSPDVPVIDSDSQQFKERVRSLVPIEQIVAERVASLKRAGNSWKACCPFHQERTPSFVVSPERGTWHCFGACGTGGDVFDFVMRFDGVAFPEALEQLASRVGLEMPRRSAPSGPKPDHQPLWDCLGDVAQQWQRELRGPAGAAALAYARERGLQEATIDAFGLGFARAGALRELARTRHWDAALLERVGLLRRADDGRYFEFFRERLMIPIRDRDGHVVGFGARVLDANSASGAKGPKYLNTGETELFHKGRLIYGLDRALAPLRRARHAILVEGYTDVMAFHQAGVSNALAVLGSATTDDHAALLRRTGA
ncbi:MAG: DNA primase, partial [Planctomycetota bacterium]